MNIKFVSGGVLIIAGLFFGTEYYWKKQFEQQARGDFQSFVSITKLNEAFNRAGLPLNIEALNQYPNILVYTNFTQDLPTSVDQSKLREGMVKASHQISCGYFEYLKQKEAGEKYHDVAKAVISVVEKDNITMQTFFKSRFGDVLYENKQVLSQCSEFVSLKLSVD